MKRNNLCLSIIIAATLLGLLPIAVQAQVGVWPGDVDNNGVVNHYDLLYLGRSIGYHGPVRLDTSIVFSEHQATLWNYTLPDTAHTNGVFADGNGDGVVNGLDTFAILKNYGNTHGIPRPEVPKAATDTDAALYFAYEDPNVTSGKQLDLHVTLGTPSLPVDSFFCVAFSWYYDTTLVKKNSVNAVLDTRWITNAANVNLNDILFVQRNIPDSGRIDVAVTQQYYHGTALAKNIGGYGNVAKISLVIEDNLIGKTEGILKLGISPSNVKLVDINLNTYAVNTLNDSVPIQVRTGVADIANISNHISLYPNPATDQVIVGMAGNIADNITLFDLAGRKMMEVAPGKSADIILNVQGIPAGFYLVRIVTNGSILTKKLSIK